MEQRSELTRFILEKVLKSTGALAALGYLLFVLAGNFRILGFWIYLATAILCQVASLIIVVPKYPALVELDRARRARHTDVKAWDKVLLWVLMLSTFVMYGLAAYDLGYLPLYHLPWWLALPGVALYVLSSMLNQWAMMNNPHFERAVRIQHDRGHRVANTGPYCYLRHPGYLGSILFYLAFPLISGSLFALLGSALGVIGTVVRTALEDRTLRKELPGYAEYAHEVRYRLIPYLW